MIVSFIQPVFSAVDFVELSVFIHYECLDTEGGVVFEKPFEHIRPGLSRGDRIGLIVIDFRLKLHLPRGQNIVSCRIVRRIFADFRLKRDLLSHIKVSIDPCGPQFIVVPVHEDPVVVLCFNFSVFRNGNSDIDVDMVPMIGNFRAPEHRVCRILRILRQCDQVPEVPAGIVIPEFKSPVIGDPRHLLLGAGVVLLRREVVHFMSCLSRERSLPAGKDPV